MKGISEIKHVGITVSDMDASKKFYRDNFRFETIADLRFTAYADGFFGEGPDSREFYNVPEGSVCDVAMLQRPEGGFILELFRFDPFETAENPPWARPGFIKISFETDTFKEVYDRVQKAGTELCLRPSLRLANNATWAFVRDPDGNLVEFFDNDRGTIGISVHDLNASIRFYCENFGFEQVESDTFKAYEDGFFGESPDSRDLYAVPEGTICRLAVLRSPKGGPEMELFEFEAQKPREFLPWFRTGYTHIAFDSDRFTEVYESLKAKGAEFCMRPGLRLADNAKWVFLRDPDGNMIEICGFDPD